IEKGNPGFTNYGESLWWTAMRVITSGSEQWPLSPEGRVLAFILAVFGYAVFGYVTATLATFFIGRDAEEKDAPIAGSKEIAALQQRVEHLVNLIESDAAQIKK
nr:two pore domain potassium channel family protein [Flavisolibacter sp.]